MTDPSTAAASLTAVDARPIASRRGPPTWLARLLDSLWPAREARRFGHVRADVRETIAELLSRTGAARDAAETLALTGHDAQALELLRRSVREAREDLAAFDGSSLAEAARRAVSDAHRALREAPAPFAVASDLELEAHRRALSSVHRALRALSWAPRDVARIGRERLLIAASVVVAFAVTTTIAEYILRAPKPVASAIRGATHPAAAVLDGDPESEWLLPDGVGGWLDLHLRPQRFVGRLRLVNAVNPPYFDRSAGKFTIEVHRDGQLVKSVTGAFDESDPEGTRAIRDVAVGERAERVRIVLEKPSRAGAGLAEVKVD
ncbi:MAG: hypothetical protein HYV09_07565 [Deltaproteobacteria bacterium]|nr:hypothetical protein [Deltaproteobacteria bacterium]